MDFEHGWISRVESKLTLSSHWVTRLLIYWIAGVPPAVFGDGRSQSISEDIEGVPHFPLSHAAVW